MYFTLAMVVLFAAILVLFSQEFIRIFKKIFAIKGVKLILPLFLASIFVLLFDDSILLVIRYCSEFLNKALVFMVHFIPVRDGTLPIAQIILLTVLSIVPVFLLEWYLWKNDYKHYKYPYLTSTLVWFIIACLLIIAS